MDAVEEVKSRLNIEDVIGEYVTLKRSGRNYKGLSPFSNEKTPSFMVSPEKQIWHDFSSGRGGNVFSFVMEVEGLEFRGALELLARKAGVDLEQFRGASKSGDSGKTKQRLYDLLDQAANFYQVQLTKHDPALRYVRSERGFSKETIIQWRLGYAPNTFDGLTKHLRAKGYTDVEMRKAGVSTERSGTLSDMFRGRIMIPLADSTGRIIGFTARLLQDEPNAPKYINTPQSPVYDKGRHVYGLHLAKEQIRKSTFVVVCEGNLDVISSHQAGVTQVVASAGTAMTEMHLRELKRFTGDIRLCFDADQAGMQATERTIPIASKLEVSLGILVLPSGVKDPDELISKNPEQWQKLLESPRYATDWLIERYASELDITSGQGKRMFTDIMLKNVRLLHDPVEQDHYLSIIADKIGVQSVALREKMQGTKSAKTPAKRIKQDASPPQAVEESRRSVDHFLSLMLMQPRLREQHSDLKADMLTYPDSVILFEFLRDNGDFNGDTKTATALRDIADYVKMLSLVYEELYTGLEFNELRYEATRLKSRVIEEYVKREKLLLGEALASATDAEARKLLTKDKKLNTLLRKSTRK